MSALHSPRTVTPAEAATAPAVTPPVHAPPSPASPAEAATAPAVTPPPVGALVAWLYNGRAQAGVVTGVALGRRAAWVQVLGQRSGARPVPRPFDGLVVLAAPDEVLEVAAARLGVDP